MNVTKKLLCILGVALSFYGTSFSQTGPGGVGNASGISGQPQNVLWLRGDVGISSSGGFVDLWSDQSGNGNNAAGTGLTRPNVIALDPNFNGQSSINFPNTGGVNFFLQVPDNDNLDNSTELTLFYVVRPTSNSTINGIFSKRTSAGVDQSYVLALNTTSQYTFTSSAGGFQVSTAVTTVPAPVGTLDIGSIILNGGTTSSTSLLDGASIRTAIAPASILNNASNLFIGSFDNAGINNFEGEIAEIILYRTALNAAQRQIVENYLSAKYNTPISGDLYAGDVSGGTTLNHDFNVAGIGQTAGFTHLLANSSGVLISPSASTIDANGDFLLIGHNSVANAAVTSNLGTGGVVQRWDRTWYLDKSGTLDANITFDFSEGIAGQFPQNKDNYVLLRLNTGTGNYDVVASIPNSDKTLIGDQISFRVPNATLTDGIYTLGTLNLTASPVNGLNSRTWFSYQTGDWTVPSSWTLDGGLVPLLVNPSNEIPSAIDNVVITSGRTISMNTNAVTINSLEVTGTLDLLASTGHNFTTITGPGRIRMAGAADNFPLGSATGFANASTGGTIEINGTGIALNQARTFRNVEINLTNTTDIASLEENYTINGDLRILNGLFRFNNDIATVNRTCTVFGDVTVSASGGLRTGIANARHEFNLHGDFTNDGTAFFTQRTDDSQRNAAEATNGIVDVNMLSASQDQLLTCNGVTSFYRVEINKGTDETYKVTLSASAPANFGLFGRAAYDINTVSGANDNAIGLRNGTLEVGNNVAIPHLNTGGNYAIFETAQLWVNGGSVTKSGGTAIVPYGRLKVTAGALTALIGSGITTRENGIIQIEGGTVDVGAIRTSVAGAGAVGSYIQSGGTVTVTGTGGISGDYAVFSLTYPGNVFNMSGGTLIVRNRPTDLGTGTLRGSIFINSDPPNVSVTGGTVIADINSTVAYKITSRAPFWNLILRNSLDATLRDIELLGTTSGVGGGAGEPTLAAQNLVVRGGLTIENNTRLDHNGRNLNIAGNLTIQATGNLIYDGSGGGGRRNITTLDGTDNATLTFLNRTGGTGDEQDFWSLVINKPADKIVTLASGKTNLSGTNNNLINVQGDAFKLFSGTLDQGFHSVRLFCDTILNYQTVGIWSGATTVSGTVSNDANDMIRFRDNTTPTVLLTTPNAVFGPVRFNRGGAPMKLNSNLRIQLLEYLFGKWDIGTHRLTIDRMVGNNGNFNEPPPGDRTQADSLNNINPLPNFGLFSVEDMIVTTGNASDGGLAIRVFGNGSYRFPVGLGTTANDGANTPGTDKYTPALATVSGFSDDGYIIINPVNGVLQTTNLLTGGPDILNYYWRVRFEGFTTLPTVKYQFTYAQGDAAGTETNYVPGKVLGISPFTRSSEAASVNTTSNIIHFDGIGAGFTLEEANYTAGASTRFTGAPTVYFVAVAAGNWNAATTWSSTRGGAGGAGIPGAGDVVIMRRGGSGGYPRGVVTIPSGYTANAAQVLFDDEQGFVSGCPRIIFQTGTPFSSNLTTIDVAPTHQGGTLNGDLHGAVLQYNVDNTYAGVFPSGDFGGYNNYLNSLVIYEWQSGTGTITLSSTATSYPQLWFQNGSASRIIKFPNVPVTVRGRAYITGGNQVMANDGASAVTLTFQRNLEIGSGCCGGGTFLFPGVAGANQTVQVDGNVLYTTGGGRSISILNPATPPTARTHRFRVNGNIDVVAGGVMSLGSGSATDTNVTLELAGTGTNTFTNAGTTTLSRIVMNKGNSIASTFTMSSPFALTGPANTATKPITLLNGLLVLNTAIAGPTDVVLTSGGGDFSIPGTAGLEVGLNFRASATTTSTNANILLDGLLRVSGGQVLLDGSGGTTDTNFIEYSNSGNSAIEVTGTGTLRVAGKIRRALTSVTGILRYTQSGTSSVLIANESSAGSDDRGVFEVVNPGSQFNHSGGDFIIVRGINSTTVPSLLLEPASANITSGSTITIGNGSTPAGATSQNIGIKASVALNNLTIAGANNPIARIYVTPLTVSNVLTISNATSLNANNQNLTIGGNFIVNGTYVPTSNTTTFSNTGTTFISGTAPTISFFNFTKSGAGTLTLSRDITINQDLRLQAGTFASGTFVVDLKRNALLDAPMTSTSGSGLIFSGTIQQQITRTLAGTSSLGIVTINNPAGVVIPDGNGYNLDVTGGLRLQQGVFDIGGSQLSLLTNAFFTPVNPFSDVNMIQTNSSFTDKGIRKTFPANYNTADFIFPVGQGFYTPVSFNFTSPLNTGGTGNPTINVRPANERHPSIVDDDEDPIGAGPEDFDDSQNVLQYHWIINADNVSTSFRSTMTLNYPQSLVSVTAPRTEAEYIAARILLDANPTKLINKFSVDEVNEATNVISFNFAGVSDAGISAEYFAGIVNAIPDNVPVYTTTGSGNVNAAIYTPAVPGGGVPRGATVIVQTGHTLTLDVTSGAVSFYEVQINPGATLTVPSGSFGHRLGTVTGTGDLRIDSNTGSAVLPAAVYDDFFSCSGGGLIFGGTGAYEILGGITELRNLTILGTGNRSLANSDLTICNNLTVSSGTLTNTSSRAITVQNDVILGANYTNNAGVLNITRDFTQTAGTFNGGTGGAKTIGRNMSVTGGTFTPGNGSSNVVTILGNMTLAGAATITAGGVGATGQRFAFAGSTAQLLTGDFSGTRAFNRLEINNSTGLTLAGNVTINSELLLTNGNIRPGVNTLLLTLSAIATPAEGRATSFVDGKLFKTLNPGSSFTFPIGDLSRWRSGAVLNTTGTATTWDMQYFGVNADFNEATVTNMNFTLPVVRIATGEYWKVSDGTVGASGRTARVGLSWGIESDVNTSSVERQDLVVMRWSGANWVSQLGQNHTGTQARGTFNGTTPISFSEQIVTIGSTDVANPLPVELVLFTGRNTNGFNHLQWRTASELENDYFELERSGTGETFESIGRIVGKGTTNLTSNYDFIDEQPVAGANYYRLKQVDFNGDFSYSNIILVKNDSESVFNISVFPNPSSRDRGITVRTLKGNDQPATVSIYDMAGRALEVYGVEEEGTFEREINTSAWAQSGIYIVEMRQNGKRIFKRIMID